MALPYLISVYKRSLATLSEHFRHHRFVMGDRPGTADFGLHGQLTQRVQVEPTSMALARTQGPRVMAWVDVVDDLSGISVEAESWIGREQLGDTFREILAELGRTYAPFMLAIAKGSDRTECLIDGQKCWQKSFSYQAKCLGWLREAYGTLGSEDRAFVDDVLEDTGAEALVAGA